VELVTKSSVCSAFALAAAGAAGAASAQHEQERRAPEHGEPHAGPHNYARVVEPKGWDHRPASVDRHFYQHKQPGARNFRIGVYHRPGGWAPHHWVYGEVPPRAYWTAPYILADYRLFALEVPPGG